MEEKDREETEMKLAVTDDAAKDALALLEKYKRQKSEIDARFVSNEEWWKMRYAPDGSDVCRSSAWLFNSIANKHADAMDNYPAPVILPREKSDAESAEVLTKVVPALLDASRFESVYSDVWYDKLKYGAGCYGVFWNPEKCGGLGDVEVTHVELTNLFWEGGVSDIQRSANVFYVETYANDYLENEYPVLRGVLSNPDFRAARYLSENSSDDSEKSAVIDWYYKKRADGHDVLHFARICAGKVLFASENEEGYENGFYAHGLYPFFIDNLYPVKASPVGFGMIDVMKGAQAQIDQLGEALVKNARLSSGVRYFIRSDGSVNEDEFADWSRPLVHVQGARLGDDSIKQIRVDPIDTNCLNVMNAKINELKETSGNRDFSQGGTTGGITAASAIAALQEAGSKLSRDTVRTSYRVFADVVSCIIELMREFYTEPRFFRIIGENEAYDYVSFCSDMIAPRKIGGVFGLDIGCREPYFDVKVSAEKRSPFARASQNELAKELYSIGIFDPARAREARACVSMMDFEGKDEVLRMIGVGGDAGGAVFGKTGQKPFGDNEAFNRAYMNYRG